MVALLALAAALSPALSWREIGPAIAGGRVAAVAGTDDNPLLYYFGSAGGGVYKTTNGGLTWNDVTPRTAVGALGAVAIAPHHPNVVWIGTGEAAPRNDASYGDGVWRSLDGGRHWQHAGLPRSYAISKIIVDARNPNVALAGVLGDPFADSTDRGVYRTRDGGRSWHRTLFAGPQSGVSDMTATPDGRTVYAGIWQFRRVPWSFTSGGTIDGIYKSADGGRTWRPLRGGGLPRGLMGRIGLAVAPADPHVVYALIQSRSGLLWRSNDAGTHWRLLSRDTLIDQRPFYMSRMIVDPLDANHVFFASENLIQTRDGGRSFQDIATAVHQDHHDFWISRNGRRIIEADDGGAPISVDGGSTWDWRFNVVLAQTYHVGYDERTPYAVCGAFQDDDSYCGPSDSLSPLGITERDWRDVANDADGVWVWPQPGKPRAIWNVGINELNGQLGIFDLGSRQNYDISPSVTDTNGRALAGIAYRFNWEAPIAFSHAGDAAYFGANVVFETRDEGRTWQRISADLTRNDPQKQQVAGGPINTDVSGAEFYDTLLDIAPSPLDANAIWTGTDDGLVQRTIDGGAHWRSAAPTGAPWGRVECVEPSRVSIDRAYAVVDRHLSGDRHPYLYATDDGGTSWRSIDFGLPHEQYAHVIREDPVDGNVLYAGLEQGVWVSFDRGAHWQSLHLNMPNVSVHDLRVQPQTHALIAGTHGRGLWILDDLTPVERLEQARRNAVPALWASGPAYTWYMWWATGYGTHDDECCASAGTFSAANPQYGASLWYYLPEQARSIGAEVIDAAGHLVRRLPADRSRGLHQLVWDLNSQPPVPWERARAWNRGPSAGPTVVPGTYAVQLRVDGALHSQPLVVRPDPRASWSHADYMRRYAFLRRLDDELSAIDEALNHLDSMRASATPLQSSAIARIYAELTSGVVNSEDDQWMADRLRERVTILQGVLALSQGPPLPPHLREAAAIRTQYDQAMASYSQFLTAERERR